MSEELTQRVKRVTGAENARLVERIQSLWSGYGAILRFELVGAASPSVIVKHVQSPDDRSHPRGWSSDLSHERKLRSYQVEEQWYADYAKLCDADCRVAKAIHLSGSEGDSGSQLLVLEDLDAAGFPVRRSSLNSDQMGACLSWLACFHARFLGSQGEGLWETGSYWHLDTRSEELEVMRNVELRASASLLDERLSDARFSTLVHGDAKVANFCFSHQREGTDVNTSVAVVDFQYVGRGVGVKDLAYFLSSCLDEEQCEREAHSWVEFYFQELAKALGSEGYSPGLVSAVESEWRSLYPIAWADFLRFLDGWAPDHFKIHGYSKRMAHQALQMVASRSK